MELVFPPARKIIKIADFYLRIVERGQRIMETVQLPCKHCGRLMAVSVQHMGMQVHCPHCQGIVQVPAAEVMTDKTWLDKPDVPREKAAAPPPREEAPVTVSSKELTAEDLLQDSPIPSRSGKESAQEPAWMKESDEKEADESSELPAAPRIQRPRESMLVPILLIFLIPYSLAMTGWVAYLLYQAHQESKNDPLERLPDPKPGDGGPQQVKHDQELPARLKTTLHQAIRVGDLEVTPTRIAW